MPDFDPGDKYIPKPRGCALTQADLCCQNPRDPANDPSTNPAVTGSTSVGQGQFSGQSSADQPIPVVFGYRKNAGCWIGAMPDQNTANSYTYGVVALSKGPIAGVNLYDIFFDGRAIHDHDNTLGTGQWYRSYIKGLTQITIKDGSYTQTNSVPAGFVGWSGPGDPGYKLPGVALMIITFDASTVAASQWTGGAPVVMPFISGFKRIWDPRGTWSNDNTWDGVPAFSWSDNPAMIAACCMTNKNWGAGLDLTAIDWDYFHAAADEYDAFQTDYALYDGSDHFHPKAFKVLQISETTTNGILMTIGAPGDAYSYAHTGDWIKVSDLAGNLAAELNNRYFRVRWGYDHEVYATTGLVLCNADMTPYVPTAAHDTADSGGTCTRQRKKFALNIALQKQASLDNWIETLKSHTNMEIQKVGGKIRCYTDAAHASIYTFTEDTPGYDDEQKKFSDVPLKEKPSAVEITFSCDTWANSAAYLDKHHGMYPGYKQYLDSTGVTVREYQNTFQTVRYPKADETVIDLKRMWRYSLEGCTDTAQAEAIAEMIYQMGNAAKMGDFECFAAGLMLDRRSVITLKNYLDLATGATAYKARVVDLTLKSSRRFSLKWRTEHWTP